MASSVTPPLARAGLSRAAERRASLPGRPDAGALVLLIDDDRAPVEPGPSPLLHWLDAASPTLATVPGEYAFLGVGTDGAERWALAVTDSATLPALPAEWGSLRRLGGDLAEEDAAALVAAVSLARWLVDSPHCPRCGALTSVVSAGWARRCGSCERDVFPRTDPAVIVAVTDASGERLLLGSHVAWGIGRYSCFAGFVEAGESLEATVSREVQEEAGVVVDDIRYVASQAWPYPRSLMLGFMATTATTDAVADGEEIVDVRWFDRAQIGAALRGETDVTLPGPASIARTLIELWHRSAP